MRPVAVDLNAISGAVVSTFGRIEFSLADLTSRDRDDVNLFMNENVFPILDPFVRGMKDSPIHLASQIMDVVGQFAASAFDFERLNNDQTISLVSFLSFDFTEADRRMGICQIPLFELTDEDWELFRSGLNIDAVADKLARIGVLQYFFPPIDQTALGLVDRGVTERKGVMQRLSMTPKLGHPFDGNEIVAHNVDVEDIIDALQDMKLIVEGEVGFDISEEGSALRGSVKFRPREGLLSKILNRIRLEISTEDWFKG